MASGTVASVAGMFMCCRIVEQSTTEATWRIKEPDGYRVMVAWLQKGGEVRTVLRSLRKSGVQCPGLLHTDTRLLIRTSLKNPKNQAKLTAVAVPTSLLGFITQFVGLRGLAWHVTLAQLVAAGTMPF